MKPLQRFILLVIYSLLAMVLFISCDDKSETGGTFAGYVYDSASTLPIDSAMISVNDTNSVGFYSDSLGYFSGVRNGTVVTLFVRKENYLTQTITIDLRDNRNDLVFNLVSIN